MTDCFEKISIMVSGIAAQLLQTSVHTGAAVISPGGRVVVVWWWRVFWWEACPVLSALTTCVMCLIAWLAHCEP